MKVIRFQIYQYKNILKLIRVSDNHKTKVKLTLEFLIFVRINSLV